MRMFKDESIRRKEILNTAVINPYFAFAFVWIFLLVFHLFNFNTKFPQAPIELILFAVITSAISIACGFLYKRKIRSIQLSNEAINEKPVTFLTIVAVLIFAIVAIKSRTVPLLSVLQGQANAYLFFGINTLTPFGHMCSMAVAAISSVKLLYGNNKKMKIYNAINLAVVLLTFVLAYSRGMFLLSALIFVAVFASRHRFTFGAFIALVILGLLAAFAFNIFGNVRQGYSWDDSSYLISLSGFNKQYMGLSNFSWAIAYFDTPFGNLAYNMQKGINEYDFMGLISQLVPDFLSKRIWPNYVGGFELVVPQLTVSSMFAGGYRYFGVIGMYVQFVEMILLVFFVSTFAKNNKMAFITVSSFLTVLLFLSFFVNTVTYSGFVLPVFIILIYCHFSMRNKPQSYSERVITVH